MDAERGRIQDSKLKEKEDEIAELEDKLKAKKAEVGPNGEPVKKRRRNYSSVRFILYSLLYHIIHLKYLTCRSRFQALYSQFVDHDLNPT